MPGCPDENVLVHLVEQSLAPAVGAEVRGHLELCDPCHETVAWLMRDRRSAPALAVTTAAASLPAGTPPPAWPAPRRGMLEPGTLVARRFEIEVAAGSGGFGTVYRAHDHRTGDRVALKVVPLAGVRERFDREAELLAGLRHPGIVGYVAHGRTPDGEGFLAMEWLDGFDLAARLRCGPLSVGETVLVFRRVVEALMPAHERGIVHRDVKPSNLFLPDCELEKLKLLDFGVAWRAAGAPLTGSDAVVGTPGYMAPEQLRDEDALTAAVDVFALGCVLYECLTGRAPFAADQIAAALVKVLFKDPTPLATLRPDVPAPLVDLVERMLRKRPEARPADAGALARELDAIGVDVEPASMPVVPAARLSTAELALQSVAVARVAAAPAELLARLGRMGADVELRADGLLVAAARRNGNAGDQAALAERIGRALAAELPGARVAVATGRGPRGKNVAGEVMDRARALLVRAPEAGVVVDELTHAVVSGPAVTGPFVGRERELAWLEATLDGCIDEGCSGAVGLVAPPGMGKSRLAREFERRARLRHPELQIIRCEVAEAGRVRASAPCLVILEDLHAADASSVEMLERLLREVRDVPFLVVALARPEVEGLFSSFWASDLVDVLPLRRLGARACERLVAALGAPAGIVEAAAGHPQTLEALAQAALAGETGVPETVVAMHQARIGQLSPLSRRVLRAGSLFGRSFRRSRVAEIIGDDVTPTALELTLDSLIRRDVLDGTSAPDDYRFRDPLVAAAAHGLLTDEDLTLAASF